MAYTTQHTICGVTWNRSDTGYHVCGAEWYPLLTGNSLVKPLWSHFSSCACNVHVNNMAGSGDNCKHTNM